LIKKMRKLFSFILLLSFLLGGFNFILAQNNKVEVNFFYGATCPHCAAEDNFLDEIEKKYPQIEIHRYLITNSENIEILKELCKQCDVEQYIGLVPMTFVEKDFFLGFDNTENIGKKIENAIKTHLEVEEIPEEPTEETQNLNKVALPFLGEVGLNSFSLPVLAVVLGFLDGFNICSLGALVLILGLVLALRSRRQILIFGGTFIFTTAVVYGILMFLWLHIFSLIGSYFKFLQILVGIIAIGGGIYFLKQFLKFRKKGAVCEIGPGDKITAKFSKYFQETIKKPRNILLLLVSILIFAVLITIIEFPCSAAVPVVYTGILIQSHLSGFQHFLYLALFLLFYMVDELIVFLIAFFTMRIWLTSSKFVAYITLAEAIVLFLLGIYYLMGI